MLSLRPATRADVPLILQLVRELATYVRAPDAVVATEADFLRDGFGHSPHFHVLLASWNREPAGFALYFYNWSTWLGRKGLYLEDLFVRPEFRGKGIGRSLLAELARIAVARKCGRLEWAVLDWNAPALGFYEKLGARAMSEWRVHRLTGSALEALARSSP